MGWRSEGQRLRGVWRGATKAGNLCQQSQLHTGYAALGAEQCAVCKQPITGAHYQCTDSNWHRAHPPTPPCPMCSTACS
jgi:hypothetical protein